MINSDMFFPKMLLQCIAVIWGNDISSGVIGFGILVGTSTFLWIVGCSIVSSKLNLNTGCI